MDKLSFIVWVYKNLDLIYAGAAFIALWLPASQGLRGPIFIMMVLALGIRALRISRRNRKNKK